MVNQRQISQQQDLRRLKQQIVQARKTHDQLLQRHHLQHLNAIQRNETQAQLKTRLQRHQKQKNLSHVKILDLLQQQQKIQKQPRQTPSQQLFDPIIPQLLKTPVIANDGVVYDRSTINKSIGRRGVKGVKIEGEKKQQQLNQAQKTKLKQIKSKLEQFKSTHYSKPDEQEKYKKKPMPIKKSQLRGKTNEKSITRAKKGTIKQLQEKMSIKTKERINQLWQQRGKEKQQQQQQEDFVLDRDIFKKWEQENEVESNLQKYKQNITKIELWGLYEKRKVKMMIVESLSSLTKLKELGLELCGIKEEEGAKDLARALPSLSNLRVLNLHSNSLRDEGTKVIANALHSLTKLEKLDLSSNDIGDEGGDEGAKAIAKALPYLTNLKNLNIQYNSIGKEGAKAIANTLPSLTKLEKLYINGNDKIGSVGGVAISHALRSLTNLKILDLNNNNIRDEGAVAIASALPYLPNLEILELQCNKIKDQGMKAIAKTLPELKKLKRLNLRGNCYTYRGNCDDGIEDIAWSLPTTKLKKLDLSDNKIGYIGAKAIAWALPYLTNLEILNLEQNEIENEGAIAIAGTFPHLTKLEKLHLSNNKIEDRGAKAIAKALPSLTNLKRLTVYRNKISGDGNSAIHQAALSSTDVSL